MEKWKDSGRSRGLSGFAFILIKERCLQEGVHSIRLDIPEDNSVMCRILEREGFEYRGKIGENSQNAYELEF